MNKHIGSDFNSFLEKERKKESMKRYIRPILSLVAAVIFIWCGWIDLSSSNTLIVRIIGALLLVTSGIDLSRSYREWKDAREASKEITP